jgi:dUTP pyrophosphatase
MFAHYRRIMRIRGFERITFHQWEKDTRALVDVNMPLCGYEEIMLPKRMTSCSAGYDVFSVVSLELHPGESFQFPTGFKAYMMFDEMISIHPRSGLGFKFFIRLANTTGVGDSDYYNNPGNEGHYWVKVRNEGYTPVSIKKGDAIAQAIFSKFLITDNDVASRNRVGGLGSTDKK